MADVRVVACQYEREPHVVVDDECQNVTDLPDHSLPARQPAHQNAVPVGSTTVVPSAGAR